MPTDPILHSQLSHALTDVLKRKHAVALWRLPHQQEIQLAASASIEKKTDVELEDSPSGFIFAPFDPTLQKIFIPATTYLLFRAGKIEGNDAELIRRSTDQKKPAPTPTWPMTAAVPARRTTSEQFKALVNQAKDLINTGAAEKIVPSRAKTVEWPSGKNALEVFLMLADAYPHAMITLVSSEETGTWMGATPEMLVRVTSDRRFETIALAGTQPRMPDTDLRNVTWTQKDIEEQAFVERYIISCFKKIRLREYEERGPRTVAAGNVIHLKTEFEVDMVAANFPKLGSVMLNLLHPTSAVCGTPMDESFQFLREHEPHDRGYYAGYLGPVQVGNESQVFVNLRCMQLLPGEAILYAGAGVIADSDPEKEWVETEMKMNTLLRIIRQ